MGRLVGALADMPAPAAGEDWKSLPNRGALLTWRKRLFARRARLLAKEPPK